MRRVTLLMLIALLSLGCIRRAELPTCNKSALVVIACDQFNDKEYRIR